MLTKKRVVRILGITVILMLCFYFVLYFFGMRSDAYQYAEKYIKENPTVASNIGQVKSMRLALFGYSLRYSGPHGYAELEVIVVGEKEKGSVYLNLEKDAGVWEMKNGNLVMENGFSMPLP